MAFVSNGYTVTITTTDEAGNTVSQTYQSAAATAGDAETGGLALAAAQQALSSGLITRVSVANNYVNDAGFLGSAGSEVENQASIIAKIDDPDPGKTKTFNIPSPIIGLFTAASGSGKNVVLGTYAALLTFLGLFQTTGGDFTISDGETLADDNVFVSGKRIHKASRKG